MIGYKNQNCFLSSFKQLSDLNDSNETVEIFRKSKRQIILFAKSRDLSDSERVWVLCNVLHRGKYIQCFIVESQKETLFRDL
jgi:hypothetical protein